jgi:TRAP transporter 4TM/12TM fusion protein
VRGGPAKVAVAASALFGTMTGSVTANVLTTGTFTIPLMKRVGYHADFAGAVEAVSSTGSQFTPPVMGGIVFIMAQWLQLPYYYVCLTAAIPAFLYYFNEFLVLDFEAARNGIKGLPKAELPSFSKTLKEGWIFLLPLIILIILLIILEMDANLAALYSSLSIILVSWFKKASRIDLKKLVTALSDTFKQFIIVGISCAAAGLIVGSLNITGLGVKLGSAFLDLSGGSIGILMILSAITAFIMGMGMPSLPIYVLLVVLLAPSLIASGVPPLCAHFFIVVSAILHFITPPVALACFAAAAISGGDMMKTGLQAVRIGIVGFIIPFWYVYRPAIMLQGGASEVVVTVILAMVSIVALSAGTMGYGLRRMNVWERIVCSIAALMLIVPGGWNNILGMAIILAMVVEQYLLWRRDSASFRAVLTNTG